MSLLIWKVGMFNRDGKVDDIIGRRVNAGNSVNGDVDAIVADEMLSKEAKPAVHDG